MTEVWKDIKGYEGLYQVSNLGRVKSLNYNQTKREKILRPKRGQYLFVGLSKEGVVKNCKIHRLVAEAFLPNPNNLPCVNHRNENKEDNRVDNLEFCTVAYNNSYGTRLQKVSQKEINGKKGKTVVQYTLKGEEIAIFPSVAEVERKLNFNQAAISRCCVGQQKTSYGYIWRYKEREVA